jgi:hypothetical protein
MSNSANNASISDRLSFIADIIATRDELTASEGLALHLLRWAARLLYIERRVADNWHDLVHRAFTEWEIRSTRHCEAPEKDVI